MSTHIVIGGPCNCGKSTLAVSLYKQLQALGVSVGIHEIDVYSDSHHCILGLKPWDRRRKRAHAEYNPTIKKRVQEFTDDQRDIVIGDLPGRLGTPYLDKLLEPADQAIVVARDWEGLDMWDECFSVYKVPITLRVISHLGQLPLIPPSTRDVLYVRGLKRQIHLNGEVSEVARHIVTKFCNSSSIIG